MEMMLTIACGAAVYFAQPDALKVGQSHIKEKRL